MISAFTSRELGYGPIELTQDQLDLVNKKRRGRTFTYSDKDAAVALFGTATKPELTKSPFVFWLDYGANADGYWNYERMVIQLEDCIDVLQVLYPQFEFVILFDHSNGHDRLQPNGLSTTKIGIRYGGKQPKMRSSKLDSDIYFGPYHNDSYKLQKGDIQHMTFPMDAKDEDGPCYLPIETRSAKRYDKKTGRMKEQERLKIDLITALREEGVRDPKGTKKELQKLCKDRNLPIKYSTEIVEEGWLGKPKGAFQILFEIGWIDPSNISKYILRREELMTWVFF